MCIAIPEFAKIMKEEEEVKSNHIEVAAKEYDKRWKMTEQEIASCWVHVFLDENVHLWHDDKTHIRNFKIQQ